MPFREKSAWIMSAALLLGGAYYFRTAMSGWSESGQLVSPIIPAVATYTAYLVGLIIVGHIIIAALASKEANTPIDERERQIFTRAGHYSSYVLAVGVVLSLGSYLVTHNGDLLFYMVFASLVVSQLAEYFLQILFYRTSF